MIGTALIAPAIQLINEQGVPGNFSQMNIIFERDQLTDGHKDAKVFKFTNDILKRVKNKFEKDQTPIVRLDFPFPLFWLMLAKEGEITAEILMSAEMCQLPARSKENGLLTIIKKIPSQIRPVFVRFK